MDPTTSALTRLEQHISAMGDVPCHLIVDPAGRWVLIANYTSGNIAVFPIQANGSLGEAAHVYHHHGHSVNHARQESAHAHCILVDPSGKYVLVADPDMDKVMIYRFDPATGALTLNDPPSATFEPGYGPRHIVFHPLGKFVYGSNRGHDSIAVFQVNADGTLTAAVIPAAQHSAVGTETGETAHVERWNNTLRQRMARFVRKTLSFSKFSVMHETGWRLFLHRVNLEHATIPF